MTVLDVYLEAGLEPVGKLSSSEDGTMSFAYITDAIPHPVSLSMPIREEPYGDVITRGFFSNLLFENEMRDQIMQRHGISERDIVGLLFHLGADCPGAISCVPEGSPPGKRPGRLDLDYGALDGSPAIPGALSAVTNPLPVAGSLAEIMASLRDHRRVPPQTEDPSPLAGVQGKIALARLPDGRLGLPHPGSGAPTTHILKVPRAADMTSVLREHLATRLMARAQTHPVAETCVLGEGDLKGLLVARFDRRLDGNVVHRVHQEDFCQALGFGHWLKYERNGGEGRAFTAGAIGRLLDATRVPAKARQAFFEITLVNLVLGNSDNHAKNHALLHTGSKPELAPAYDIDPVMLDNVTHEMSFRIGEARVADDITGEDLDRFLKALGARSFGKPQQRRTASIIQTLLKAADELPRPAGKGLCDVIRQQAHHLSCNIGLGLDVPEFDAVPVNRP
ncbi:HipA domain-containing protein [Rhodovulum strictum]|uniref:Type II toxin-antitoxin system HipA family toxin n=1 Tax=Rhodovulum strictum TaxID=58314 RepID=A0A844BCF0_9RHOB|nr:HipA domain-containing protein [Rhodovulum strictum]MRH22134.1 type II toxin-antitoxin system HipA family toxin [Rhodovulum strictum]